MYVQLGLCVCAEKFLCIKVCVCFYDGMCVFVRVSQWSFVCGLVFVCVFGISVSAKWSLFVRFLCLCFL